MEHAEQAACVKAFVQQQLGDLGRATGDILETMLLSEDNYCGRRYRSGEFTFDWLIETNSLEMRQPSQPSRRFDLDSVNLVKSPTVDSEHCPSPIAISEMTPELTEQEPRDAEAPTHDPGQTDSANRANAA